MPLSRLLAIALCLVSPAAEGLVPVPSVHPAVRRAFAAHSRSASLNRTQLRRALADLGADVTPLTADRLLDRYGTISCNVDTHECRPVASVHDLQRIVHTSSVASPANLWIAVDPTGDGVRSVRRGWNRFGKAGMATPMRQMHYAAGLAALMVGASDFVDVLNHLGESTVSPQTASVHAGIATAAAVMSLSLFKYKWTPGRPLFLWMPTARDANMWPSFITMFWYWAALLSDFILSPSDALFSCNEPWFIGLTVLNSIVSFYGPWRSAVENPIDDLNSNDSLYDSSLLNMMNGVLTAAAPVILDTVRCLFLAMCPAKLDAHHMVTMQYPEYTKIMFGAVLAGNFTFNVVSALASAVHHKAVSREQIRDLNNALTLVVVSLTVSRFILVDDGNMMRAMWSALLA